jgi:hypothetical protein
VQTWCREEEEKVPENQRESVEKERESSRERKTREFNQTERNREG